MAKHIYLRIGASSTWVLSIRPALCAARPPLRFLRFLRYFVLCDPVPPVPSVTSRHREAILALTNLLSNPSSPSDPSAGAHRRASAGTSQSSGPGVPDARTGSRCRRSAASSASASVETTPMPRDSACMRRGWSGSPRAMWRTFELLAPTVSTQLSEVIVDDQVDAQRARELAARARGRGQDRRHVEAVRSSHTCVCSCTVSPPLGGRLVMKNTSQRPCLEISYSRAICTGS